MAESQPTDYKTAIHAVLLNIERYSFQSVTVTTFLKNHVIAAGFKVAFDL